MIQNVFHSVYVLFKALVGGLLYFWALNVSVAVYKFDFWDLYMWSMLGTFVVGLYVGANLRR